MQRCRQFAQVRLDGVSGLSEAPDVAAAAEELAAACDHDAADGVVIVTVQRRFQQRTRHWQIDRVALLGSVERKGCDSLLDREGDPVCHDASSRARTPSSASCGKLLARSRATRADADACCALLAAPG